MKYYIWTIGCQYNEWDGARIRFALDELGLIETSSDDADVIIILACAVRQTAVNRIYGKINTWKNKKVVISGCVLKQDKRNLEDQGAVVIGWDKMEKIAPYLNIKNQEKFKDLLNKGNTASAYIPITTGCNNFCSYCIVPYTRGRELSRPINEIIFEAKKILSHYHTSKYRSGKPEIILLGQNVNSYQFGFAKLLKKLNDLPGDFEISFISNHPKDMTEELIDAMAKLPKVKKEIHLPLQSGSDKVLKDMNRPYTVTKYLQLVESLKFKIENLKISTDIIVGFPTETEEDFQKTVKVCEKVDYSLAYINKYSPRKGTAAYKLGDPISWREKQRRWRVLEDLINN